MDSYGTHAHEHLVGRWKTCCELHFLAGLGGWRASTEEDVARAAARRAVRLRLLRAYAEAMDGREDWGLVDAAAVRAYVAREVGAV